MGTSGGQGHLWDSWPSSGEQPHPSPCDSPAGAWGLGLQAAKPSRGPGVSAQPRVQLGFWGRLPTSGPGSSTPLGLGLPSHRVESWSPVLKGSAVIGSQDGHASVPPRSSPSWPPDPPKGPPHTPRDGQHWADCLGSLCVSVSLFTMSTSHHQLLGAATVREVTSLCQDPGYFWSIAGLLCLFSKHSGPGHPAGPHHPPPARPPCAWAGPALPCASASQRADQGVRRGFPRVPQIQPGGLQVGPERGEKLRLILAYFAIKCLLNDVPKNADPGLRG